MREQVQRRSGQGAQQPAVEAAAADGGPYPGGTVPAGLLGGKAGGGNAHPSGGDDRGQSAHSHNQLHSAQTCRTHNPGDVDLKHHLNKTDDNGTQSQQNCPVKDGVLWPKGAGIVLHGNTSGEKYALRWTNMQDCPEHLSSSQVMI